MKYHDKKICNIWKNWKPILELIRYCDSCEIDEIWFNKIEIREVIKKKKKTLTLGLLVIINHQERV